MLLEPIDPTDPTTASGRASSPAVGEHPVDGLTVLGFTTEEVDTLLDAKVVCQPEVAN